MAKLMILGSCSGTEPMPGRHHTSFLIETGGQVYFFDAGENCAYASHLAGVDLLRMRAIFISHPHIDHVGGLANLIWTVHKLAWVKKTLDARKRIDLYMPEMRAWEAIVQMLRYTAGGDGATETVDAHRTVDGLVYADENIRVTALHNGHLPDNDRGEHVSYSYRIEIGGKSIVFSGDVRHHTEVAPLIGAGCDYLLMETGHHKVKDICAFADAQPVGKLIFVHHGREILNESPQVSEALEACGCAPVIAWDGMTIAL